ncbi:hypothetical protein OH76DRAFT_203434 [Lentinus brumalis]|uniref:Uncharacterized protein n=1 Tax=Lentinus brumalis TaxID=2498619 RepID=A0A371DIA2_9APHY|nr:hypothetical protein OH76DRAFT_203434 [Polyporus brumalis]
MPSPQRDATRRYGRAGIINTIASARSPPSLQAGRAPASEGRRKYVVPDETRSAATQLAGSRGPPQSGSRGVPHPLVIVSMRPGGRLPRPRRSPCALRSTRDWHYVLLTSSCRDSRPGPRRITAVRCAYTVYRIRTDVAAAGIIIVVQCMCGTLACPRTDDVDSRVLEYTRSPLRPQALCGSGPSLA